MAKLALLLALSHAGFLLALPTADKKREPDVIDAREITISSDLEVTTSYSSAAVSSLQSATVTVQPSVTGVCNLYLLCLHSQMVCRINSLTKLVVVHSDGSTVPRFHP